MTTRRCHIDVRTACGSGRSIEVPDRLLHEAIDLTMKKARTRSGKAASAPAGVTNKNLSAVNDFLSDSRALFLIIASTVLVYANSLSGAFVFDDTKQIAGNPALRSWSNIARAFTSDVWAFQRGTLTKDIPPPYYRPLFTAYLTINYQLF